MMALLYVETMMTLFCLRLLLYLRRLYLPSFNHFNPFIYNEIPSSIQESLPWLDFGHWVFNEVDIYPISWWLQYCPCNREVQKQISKSLRATWFLSFLVVNMMLIFVLFTEYFLSLTIYFEILGVLVSSGSYSWGSSMYITNWLFDNL